MMRVGVGIIGYGFIGKAHTFGYRSIPFHYDPPPLEARLVGVATSRPETAEAARTHGGFEMATADWRKLVERRDIQIINICTPTAEHAVQLIAAMAAGKHIYCEKPLLAAASERDAVRKAIAGWSGIGQVTFQNRFFSATLRAKQLINEGFLGEPVSFRGVYLHGGSVDPAAPMRWRFRKSAGGGVLRDLGSHLLDLVDWLAGPITAIQASSRILYPVRPDGRGGTERVEAEDQMVMTARIANGAIGTLEASKIATGAEDDFRVEIHGTRGAIRFDLMQPDFLEAYSLSDPDAPIGGTRGWKKIATVQRFPSPAVFPSPRSSSGWLRGHTHCLYSFLRSVAEGAPAEPSLARGCAVEDLIACAERSSATGTWQAVERE
ncbi:MAG: Gfo/Idh/MocA family oxidoreductase [Spirochaetia bacterium]|jgi:predicted dehydrogenase